MVVPSSSEIIAIIRRDPQGLLERCEKANVDGDECITLVPVSGGFVAVIGALCENDQPALETLLSSLAT